MPIHEVKVAFHDDSGLPEDDIVNTFHFSTVAGSSAGLGAVLLGLMDEFYDSPTSAPSGNALSNYFPATLASPATVKCYNLSDAPPRVPYFTGTFGHGATGSALPREIALRITAHAALPSGVDARNRRGGPFFGPLEDNANVNGRPAADLLLVARLAADRLRANAQNTLVPADLEWVIYSPTEGQGYPIVGGWVDDEFDIVRSRGLRRTAKNTWPA